MVSREAQAVIEQLIQEMRQIQAELNTEIDRGGSPRQWDLAGRIGVAADRLALLANVLGSPTSHDQKNHEDTRVDRQCAPTDSR